MELLSVKKRVDQQLKTHTIHLFDLAHLINGIS